MAKKKTAKKAPSKKKAAKKKVTGKKSVPVESIKHASDSRKNIPTEELRDFVPDEPPETMLYPRDPSLDPQLVWKGKDEQDRQPLEVPVVPVYIQEKIHPQAIVVDVRKRLGTPEAKPQERQLDLFGDFNGIEDFAQKVDFYQHDQHWSNRMILGDSLLVMTSLAEKEGLKGQVQMIYIDPPYGTKLQVIPLTAVYPPAAFDWGLMASSFLTTHCLSWRSYIERF